MLFKTLISQTQAKLLLRLYLDRNSLFFQICCFHIGMANKVQEKIKKQYRLMYYPKPQNKIIQLITKQKPICPIQHTHTLPTIKYSHNKKQDQTVQKEETNRNPFYFFSLHLHQNTEQHNNFDQIDPFDFTFDRQLIGKNSNSVKKYVRMLIKYSYLFKICSKNEIMMKDLKLKQLNRKHEKDLSDNFNAFDLHICHHQVSTFNRKIVDVLLAQKLRKQILDSFQLRHVNKLLYLNTLKCCKLRLWNKQLAVRLKMPY